MQLCPGIVTNGRNIALERFALVTGVQVGQVDQVAAVGGGIVVRRRGQPIWKLLVNLADTRQLVIAHFFDAGRDLGDGGST